MNVPKQHGNESFFAFFDPSVKESNEDLDQECKAEISYQFLVGEFIRDEVQYSTIYFYIIIFFALDHPKRCTHLH